MGKYVELEDAVYESVREALRHVARAIDRDVEIEWVHSERLERPGGIEALVSAGGILVPGGFGERGIEGKINAARYAVSTASRLWPVPGDAGDVHRVCAQRARPDGGQ